MAQEGHRGIPLTKFEVLIAAAALREAAGALDDENFDDRLHWRWDHADQLLDRLVQVYDSMQDAPEDAPVEVSLDPAQLMLIRGCLDVMDEELDEPEFQTRTAAYRWEAHAFRDKLDGLIEQRTG